MIALLLILIPLAGGLAGFAVKSASLGRTLGLLVSLATLALMLGLLGGFFPATQKSFFIDWLPQLGADFSLKMDGVAASLCLLTAFCFPVIIGSVKHTQYANANAFYSLLLLAYAGINLVFLAADGLLFYFGWELALIPVYFLCSKWGGEKRLQVTFKFFLYTFLGSLLMLAGLVYLYYHTADYSFSLDALYQAKLTPNQETVLFWLFFVAFAIKMPVFPFHTWQPDTYEQSATPVTMVLSALMVKMGLFGVVRWLLPLFPHASVQFADVVILLSVIGMIYASMLAMKQDDIKRLIAYSSIAHIGLMSAALFIHNASGIQGAMIQFFSHGVNVLGMWLVVEWIEQQTGTRKISELGGLAQKAPILTILLIIVALANIALPLTNAFVGELMMFNGLFKYNLIYAAVGGLSIILSAVYTLRMIQHVFYGEVKVATANVADVMGGLKWGLLLIIPVILVFGIYPTPMLNLVKDSVAFLLSLGK
ncbi:MAG: NADH-quinone oxidoreductase subunit M [Bacteroidetes bacterium]|nr:NADH-quinone oxidoreductase subunit M [Bacteroidota bacterium]